MKKTIAWLLLVVMLLGTFAGCGNAEQTPTTAAENGAADAIAYLKAYYKDAGTETFADFDRLGIVRIAGVAYTVVWTADVAEDLIKVVVNEDGSVTIDVNESNETATPYNLTATVTDDAGNTASHSWNYILPVGLGNDYGAIVDMAYELENGQAFEFDSTLVGTVTAINTAWSDEYKNITVTIVIEGREDKPIMCYRLKGEGAQDLAAGDLITVTGKLKNYNGTIEFDSGCTLDKVEKGAGTLGDVPTDPLEIVDAAFALEVGASLPYTATLTGEVVSIDTPYSADYKNITVSIKVEGREDKPIMCYRMKGEGADQVMPGDTITVSGVIKNYNGTIEFDAGCSLVELIKGENSFVMPSTTAELLEMAYNLKVGEAIPVQVTLTGLIFEVDTPYSDRYNNISVWMVVDGMYDKPVLAFRMKGADVDKIWTNDTITVTGTLKNYNGTVEFDAGCKLDSWIDTGLNPSYPKTQKEIVDALYALRENETFHGIYSLTGRVVEADAYSINYGNQSITIDVEGRLVDVYRMTTGGVAVAEGDFVTVRGNLEDYKGSKQISSGYLTWYDETTLAEAMAECEALGDGGRLSYNEVTTGTIKITSPYSSQYNNISFELTDAYGTTVLCYRVKGYGMENWVDGDTVTVSGKLVNFKGTAQYDSSARVVCQRIIPETLESQIEAASFLSNGVYLHVPSTIIGKVSFIDSPYSAQYGNISFYVTNEEGIELYCYRVKGDGMDKLALGDTVKVEGYLTAYKGTAQFDSTATVTILEKGDGTYDDGKEEVTYKNFAEMVEAASKLKNNETLGVTTTQTGVIVGDLSYYAKNDNWQFTMDVNGVKIYCYGVLQGEKDVKVGGTATITGDLTAYNGKAQFSYNTVIEDSYTAPAGGETPDEPSEPETEPIEPEKPTYNTFAEMVEAAAKLANKETLGVTTTQTGVIVGTPKYAATYDNWEFTLDVDGVEIYCYALLKGVADVKEGGTVTVTGDLTAHYGKPQFSKDTVTNITYTAPAGGSEGEGGETPDTPTYNSFAEMVEAASKLANNKTLGVTTTQTGTITDTPSFSEDHGNWSFTLNVDGVEIYCYGLLDGEASVVKGGTVTVTGDLTAFNGKAQFTYATVTAATYTAPAGGSEGEGGETPDTPVVPETPKVVNVANGTYLIVVGNLAMTTTGATSGFGYPTGTQITWGTDGVTGYVQDNIFTITNTSNGKFTIKDTSGVLFCGPSGTYTSFNFNASAATEWIAYETETDGVYTLKNVATEGTVAYSTSKTQYRVYSSLYDDCIATIALIAVPATAPETPGEDEVLDTLEKQIAAANKLSNNTYLTVESTITGTVAVEEAYSSEFGNITFTVTNSDGITLKCFRIPVSSEDTIGDGDTVTVKGYLTAYNGSAQFDKNATVTVDAKAEKPDQPGEGGEGETTTVTIKISDIATANGWSNSIRYSSFSFGEFFTASVTSEKNNNSGKYYTSGNQWRIYEADVSTFTIAASGKTIVSVKVTYVVEKGGCLVLNGTMINSNQVVPINGTSVTFDIGDTSDSQNGQARVTAIEVVYK